MQRMTAGRRIATGAVLALLASGCGGGGGGGSATDQQAVKQTARAFLAALASGDGARACGLATPAAQTYLAANVQARVNRRLTCQQIVQLLGRLLPSAVKAGLESAQISKVTISGNTATIRDQDVSSKSGNVHPFLGGGVTTLSKVNGVWLLSH